ncbi:MAG: ectoine/hydroxyectoine ABC transporter substrate-binding protein EhuB [Halofilum sp. (in: g-proteobacteria)]|nr:ectoine/hydroxyectoine ABC transporter substrate-binding protein EhuB [Halofilum sp. (in: g-proteobacteria)]
MSRAATRPVIRLLQASLVLVVAGLYAGTALAQGTLERIKETDRIGVAVANERPYGYITEAGELSGESPTIAREILRRIDPGIEMQGISMDWGNLIPRLNDGDVDVVAAGMFITPARCEQVAFSNPTYVVGESFLVRAGNPLDLESYEDISRNPEARVGLVAGTVEYNYATNSGIRASQAPLYRDFRRAVDALVEGEVDAVGLTSLTARSLARSTEAADLEATPQFYPVIDGEEIKGYGAFAFRKEDEALVAAFNRHLDDFIGSEAHWDAVEEFGFAPDMMPDKTAAELCAG